MILNSKKKYLQVALNGTMGEAFGVIGKLPVSDRILLEAGTPLIKRYGIGAVAEIRQWWQRRLGQSGIHPYVVADLKTMDRGAVEVDMAKQAGASGVVALGQAPVETVNSFIEKCQDQKIDSMIDMMNVEYPIKILRKYKKKPDVVILHRGVDETEFNRDKPIPYIQINKIRSTLEAMIAIAGGDSVREVQRAIFNDADIVIVWKEFYQPDGQTSKLAEDFLKEIK